MALAEHELCLHIGGAALVVVVADIRQQELSGTGQLALERAGPAALEVDGVQKQGRRLLWGECLVWFVCGIKLAEPGKRQFFSSATKL